MTVPARMVDAVLAAWNTHPWQSPLSPAEQHAAAVLAVEAVQEAHGRPFRAHPPGATEMRRCARGCGREIEVPAGVVSARCVRCPTP